ncbi:hypothetical protein LUZ60_006549 [Juncus effusus]|nr:hypothetical protein LUZ60_006549 [Juncus effusus]
MSKLDISIALFISLIISSDAYNIPALFSFSDSTMDPGNSNNLKTDAKANFLLYGKDFLTHTPTGRFCNGKLATDYIAAALNLSDVLPAYDGHVVSVNDIGVSFASAGSGLDDLDIKILECDYHVQPNPEIY